MTSSNAIPDAKTYRKITKKLGIGVKNFDLLQQALTHKSYLGESSEALSNERLEFLGDSVLGVVVSEYLFAQFPDRPEGELAKAKAVAVSEPVLAESAKALGLSDMVQMSAGEELSGGRCRHSILADTFEALIAVVYLDCGLESARGFILKALKLILKDIERQEHLRDYKTMLQEQTQGLYKRAPQYVVIDEQGADHDKTFTIEARLDDSVLGRGEGKSKKQAEQAAALQALKGITDNQVLVRETRD